MKEGCVWNFQRWSWSGNPIFGAADGLDFYCPGTLQWPAHLVARNPYGNAVYGHGRSAPRHVFARETLDCRGYDE
jgi:hypothetical protein